MPWWLSRPLVLSADAPNHPPVSNVRVFHYRDVPLEDVEMEGCKGVKVRWLLRTEHGAERFWMRVFEVEPSGYTPYPVSYTHLTLPTTERV